MRDIENPAPLGGNRAGFAIASRTQPYTRTPPETQVEPDWSVPRLDAVDSIAALLVRARTGGRLMARARGVPPDKARGAGPGATGTCVLEKGTKHRIDIRSLRRPQASHLAAALRFLGPARRGWR